MLNVAAPHAGAVRSVSTPADATPRRVFCVKLRRELPGLAAPPWPGPLGQRIYEQVSAEAWELWEERMKMILNEYQLLPFKKEAQELVAKHMEEFLFGDAAGAPPGFVPERK
jgi:Fe-S cluster biosynthesis and repair protein YggX